MNEINAILLVDKPAGITSHFVVSKLKRILKPQRIGHLGTLDPFATGLLPIMLGGGTKLADSVMDGEKGYIFDISFGSETSTLDPTGTLVRQAAVTDVNLDSLKNVVENQFLGMIEQVPPAYSALKVNGRPLYEYMRAEGQLPIDIESKRRKISIFRAEVLDFSQGSDSQPPVATLQVRCSKGTYVRCLARDIAMALNSAGTCSSLRRDKVAHWTLDNPYLLHWSELEALPPEEQAAFLTQKLRAVTEMVPHMEILEIKEERYLNALRSGNSILANPAEVFVISGAHSQEEEKRFPVTLFWPEGKNCDISKQVLLRGGKLLYLAEFSIVCDTLITGQLKIQPRKLLDW